MNDLAKDAVDSFYYSTIAGFSNNFLRTSSCLNVDTFVAYHSTSADVARCFFWMSWQVGLLTGNPRESESDRSIWNSKFDSTLFAVDFSMQTIYSLYVPRHVISNNVAFWQV